MEPSPFPRFLAIFYSSPLDNPLFSLRTQTPRHLADRQDMMSVGRPSLQVPKRALSQGLRPVPILEIVDLALDICYLILEFFHFIVNLLKLGRHLEQLKLEFRAIHHALQTVFDLCNLRLDVLKLGNQLVPLELEVLGI